MSLSSTYPYKNLTKMEEDRLRIGRYKARTDLLWLCNNILGYKDINQRVHGPILDALPKFSHPPPQDFEKYDFVKGGRWSYQPHLPFYEIECFKNVLILDPRGWMKTSLDGIAHTIQCILNYPEITLMLVSSTIQRTEDIMSEIKQHFQWNAKLRELFPDHCPQKKNISDWYTKSSFNTEARSLGFFKKETTVMAGSIDKAVAGYHCDIIKFVDIVDETNSNTRSSIESINKSFGMYRNIVVRHDSWRIVEGTRYDMSDTYGKIIDSEKERVKKGMEPLWKIHVRGCYKKDTPDGKPQQFTPDELEYPDKKDRNGELISWWPERWPTEKLEELRLDPAQSEELFANQQRNAPNDLSDESLIPFPIKGFYTTISRENFRHNIRIAHHEVTIDTADTQNEKSKFSVITVGAWDSYGRLYIHDIRHGRFMPDTIVNHIFDVQEKYNPITVKIEDYAFVRGLMPSIRRKIDAKEINPQTNRPYPEVHFTIVKRETDLAKTERILNTLHSPYKAGNIRFLDDLSCSDAVKKELSGFPRYAYTDILDTLSDFFNGRTWFGRNEARPTPHQVHEIELKKLLDIGNPYNPDYQSNIPEPFDDYYRSTGGL